MLPIMFENSRRGLAEVVKVTRGPLGIILYHAQLSDKSRRLYTQLFGSQVSCRCELDCSVGGVGRRGGGGCYELSQPMRDGIC